MLHDAGRKRSSSTQAVVTAVVDINLLLEMVKGTDLQSGEWVNIMGYVRSKQEHFNKGRDRAPERFKSIEIVDVQAVMLWSAGTLKIEDYEQALACRTAQSSRRSN